MHMSAAKGIQEEKETKLQQAGSFQILELILEIIQLIQNSGKVKYGAEQKERNSEGRELEKLSPREVMKARNWGNSVLFLWGRLQPCSVIKCNNCMQQIQSQTASIKQFLSLERS